MWDKLKKVNQSLWEIEDEIRLLEKKKNFDEKFIELARSVYKHNDNRAKIKLQINQINWIRYKRDKSIQSINLFNYFSKYSIFFN